MDVKGKDNERGKIPSFDSIELKDIDSYLQTAQKEGKYVFIADLNGNVPIFMGYSRAYLPFSWCDEVKKAIIAKS